MPDEIVKSLVSNPEEYAALVPDNFDAFFTTQHFRDSKLVEEWLRSKKNPIDLELAIETLRKHVPAATKKFKAPKRLNKDLMLEWCIADTHMGMHSWAKETGANYNLKIAKNLVLRAADRVFTVFSKVSKINLVLLGDTQHADNRTSTTEKSGNHLDTDSRYPKAVEYAIETFCSAIDLALQNAKEVEVIIIFGNHDYHSAVWLQYLLNFGYRNEKRVTINTSLAKMKYTRWGISYFGYHHGDSATAARLTDQFLNHIIETDQVGVRRKLLRKGHLHKESRQFPPGLTDHNGVTIEIMPTLAAPEAYTIDAAWNSVRMTKAQLFHKKYGPQQTLEIPTIQLMENF